MKILFATVLLWVGMFMTQVKGQTPIILHGDSLNILTQDRVYARVICPNIYKLKDENSIEKLLTSFMNHLESIKDQIPDYTDYQIIYYEGTKLIVEELVGRKKYHFQKNKLVSAYHQNTACISDGEVNVLLYFDKIEDLTKQNYTITIQNALDKIREKTKRKKRSKIFAIYKTYNYSYSEGRLIPNSELNPNKRRLAYISSGSVGLFKNKPIYEILGGFGYRIGPSNDKILFVSYNTTLQFDEEIEENRFGSLIEFGWFYKKSAIRYGIPLRRGIDDLFNDIDGRIGVTVYPYGKFSFGFQYYLNFNNSRKIFPALNIGFGI